MITSENAAALLDHARNVIRHRLAQQAFTPPAAPSAELMQLAGSFVTLHEQQTNRLRGCVGRLDATMPLWDCVTYTAGAALDDPRFANDRLTLADLPKLTIEISVISPPYPSHPTQFDLLNEGIVLQLGGRTGCFLPQVARETGWGREQLLSRLCSEKLGLAPELWRHPEAKLFAFNVEVVGPEPF